MGKGKHIGLGVAALAAGAGVAALAAGSHKNNGERAQKKAVEEKAVSYTHLTLPTIYSV